MNSTCPIYNTTFSNVDELGCRIIRTAAALFFYDFGYICMGPLGLIIVISLFGRLKGHYRWFILNQAIWDLSASYCYSCNNLMAAYVKKAPTCFYSTITYVSDIRYWHTTIDFFTHRVILYNSYSALLLLSLSRFMALYYPHAYAKLIKGRNILYTIVLFNLISILFDIYPFFLYLRVTRQNDFIVECVIQQNTTAAKCNALKVYENDFMYNVYRILSQGFELIQCLKLPLFLFLSVIAVVMVIWKMAKQLMFQLKQDRKDFSGTVRIAVVIGLQVVINCFGVFLEIFYKFLPTMISTFQLKILITRAFVAGNDYAGYWDLRLPIWLDGVNGLSSETCRPMVIQLRIMVEAFIVLVIMTGYREAVMDFVKYIYKMLRLKNLIGYNCFSKKPVVSQTSLF